MQRFRYGPALPQTPPFTWGDLLIILAIVGVLYLGARLAFASPTAVQGPDISLSPAALPWYATLSTARMTVAYALALSFSIGYGYIAARNRTARRLLMPLLDVLQSVPILSFLPVVLLSLSVFLPEAAAAELAAIVLIFTSQAWNMTFSFYQSMTTIPMDLREASAIYRFNPWLRFRSMELPFAAIGLIYNSMMSWAGGWFFLMAAETFQVGDRDFRLPGLGSYLQTAANAANFPAIFAGLAVLISIIVAMDQLIWRPLIAWSDKFKVEMTEGGEPPSSWFLEVLSRSYLVERYEAHIWRPFLNRLDLFFQTRARFKVVAPEKQGAPQRASPATWLVFGVLGVIIAYLGFRAFGMLATLPLGTYREIGVSVLATLARVAVALVIALLWTVPVGVLIGTNRRAANMLQPIVQITAAVPATALFPVLLLLLVNTRGGLNLAAVVLMLLGTQWYLLFNVIAGASAIPQDLRYTTTLLRLGRSDRWRHLFLPSLFPFIITGAITAAGGAWNASIVAESVQFNGQTYAVTGIGAMIAQATAAGNFALLLAATLALVLTVVIINRTFWLRLYRIAEERYRME